MRYEFLKLFVSLYCSITCKWMEEETMSLNLTVYGLNPSRRKRWSMDHNNDLFLKAFSWASRCVNHSLWNHLKICARMILQRFTLMNLHELHVDLKQYYCVPIELKTLYIIRRCWNIMAFLHLRERIVTLDKYLSGRGYCAFSEKIFVRNKTGFVIPFKNQAFVI